MRYNAGGSGDNLYGVEPISYYVKNLLLMLNVAFPLAVVALVVEPLHYLVLRVKENRHSSVIVAYGMVIAWLSIMFSRPHKVGLLSLSLIKPILSFFIHD